VCLQHLATTLAQLRRVADEALEESFIFGVLDSLTVPGHVRTAGRLFLWRAGHSMRRRTWHESNREGVQDARRERGFIRHLSLP